ncbi:molybdenum cofactor guanylyltransferase [Candidatus Uabimicrobium amorphum]|uniref:Molybdenum cofactor guanylyltransferase n=1 Tax=Uabimicrobium amorphum TaxID=2596890 RepID=A0A5S9IP07_UABAM|nr:molybdenum cofactor guanylyltransferase [Candidatus Uabimicrobium amorphum]BBM84055.1 Molybdenum cofactor guanylyltransferase [Candidatus Uabimicrobium amorphum]
MHGVVLNGGKSTRMGRDKGQLIYHSHPQTIHCYHLLQTVCSDVVISCREDQKKLYSDYSTVIDLYENCGPISGLLSVYEYTKSPLLVLACDLPFFNENTLQHLYKNRNSTKAATVYTHSDQRLEPLCSIWEISALEALRAQFLSGKYGLNRILNQLPIQRIPIVNPQSFTNVNEYDVYKKITKKT